MFRVNMPEKIFPSRAVKEIKKKIAQLEPGSILLILGEVGIGKTIATIDALGEYETEGHNIIYCRQPDKENLKIGVILNALIRHFGESPRKDIDARTEQLRRLLGRSWETGKKTYLVIDEAHALHHSTLRALKRLLELPFARQIGLLSIILISQPEIYEKINNLEEIQLRTEILPMKPLTVEESKEFIQFVASWSKFKITPDVVDYLSARMDNPLRIVVALDRIYDFARRIGEPITISKLKQYIILPIRKKLQDEGISIREVAERTGYSPTTISQVLQGKYQGDVKKVIESVEKVLQEA